MKERWSDSDIIDDNQFQLVLDTMPGRVFWKDLNHTYRGANLAFARDIGFDSVADIIGKTDFDTSASQDQMQAFVDDDRAVMSSGMPKLRIEEPQTRADNRTYWLETNKIPLKDSDGNVIGLLGTYHDITDRVEARQEIEYQAVHDQLTKLPNRRYLMSRIEALDQMPNRSNWGALLFLDLDQFKQVNDSLGHQVGDCLLQLVAERINSTINVAQGVCRTGGDEFSVLLEDLGSDESLALQSATNRAESIVNGLAAPFYVNEHCLYIGVSIGLTLISPRSKYLQSKLREADVAMYEAKAQGQNIVQSYSEEMRLRTDRCYSLQNRLRQAVQTGGFNLVYQPQVDVDGTLICAEVLLRWNDDELGSVSPLEFIPLAERTGAIHAIGDWVLDAALQQIVDWESRFQLAPTFKLAVNISAVQFSDRNFVNKIKCAVASYGAAASRLELEITESLLLENEDNILIALNELRAAGFNIVIDDFGTGYSSLSYLTYIPFNKLKLDRSFISRIAADKHQHGIAMAVTMLARTLNVKLVSEGIETSEELAVLATLGSDLFQGYYFAAGLPSSDFAKRYLIE
ncbi:sensor domain-containing protein [Candidatus Nitrotoga sp. M5]|uniref:sensor domain-containing protein n=1 Tax=Candidatus Nitrotoga sp. M5 TaxID=2890409 RepID=UPI001EF5A1F0|nr:GGDEF and EAL domain-containing protein [Candidatus Nitrotoga sp. M5]CAH1387855.1 putative Diguanylate cyclase [Candidatus Nitrotoga sp. M5]